MNIFGAFNWSYIGEMGERGENYIAREVAQIISKRLVRMSSCCNCRRKGAEAELVPTTPVVFEVIQDVTLCTE